jgi:hypothetical protein
MFEKRYSHFRKIFSVLFIIIALSSIIFSSCKKEKAPFVDPNTLPIANFFIEKTQYKRIGDNYYAHITTINNSSYSNRWEWERKGSIERLDTIYYGLTKFMTDKDSAVTHVYLATQAEQKFLISLTAFSDVIGMDTTFVSHPFVREVKIQIPPQQDN